MLYDEVCGMAKAVKYVTTQRLESLKYVTLWCLIYAYWSCITF
jgi:hypothetical protein